MVDTLSVRRRSANMAAIRSGGTKPELIVRRTTHNLGYRFRLHCKDLPGKPDLVFPARRKIIFVHGCFWHQHPDPDCLDSRLPKSNTGYWHSKLKRNVERDKTHTAALKMLGWKVLVIWDCQTKNTRCLLGRLTAFLGETSSVTRRKRSAKTGVVGR